MATAPSNRDGKLTTYLQVNHSELGNCSNAGYFSFPQDYQPS